MTTHRSQSVSGAQLASTKTWKHRHRALSVQPGSMQIPRVRTCVPRARPEHTHRLLVSAHVSCARLAHTLHRVRLSAPHVSRGVPTTIRILLHPVCHAVPGSTRPKQAPHAQTVLLGWRIWTATPPLYAPHVMPASLQTSEHLCAVRARMVSMTMTPIQVHPATVVRFAKLVRW